MRTAGCALRWPGRRVARQAEPGGVPELARLAHGVEVARIGRTATYSKWSVTVDHGSRPRARRFPRRRRDLVVHGLISRARSWLNIIGSVPPNGLCLTWKKYAGSARCRHSRRRCGPPARGRCRAAAARCRSAGLRRGRRLDSTVSLHTSSSARRQQRHARRARRQAVAITRETSAARPGRSARRGSPGRARPSGWRFRRRR